MSTVRAQQGDTLDRLLYRILGITGGVTEQVLELNPGLADLGPILPEGTPVKLPERPAPKTENPLQLWN